MNSNPKIVLKVNSNQELEKIAESAKEKGINYYLLKKKITVMKNKVD